MKTIAVITALNEQDTIGPLTTALFAYCEDVIVINDGSTDNTGVLASQAGAHVITHAERQGIAYSLMQAWQIAIDEGADRIVQIDAGRSHDPHDLWQMLRYQPDADVIIGSRFVSGGEYIGGWRKHASKFYASACNWAVAKMVTHDWTSGYRIYSRRAIIALLKPPSYWTRMHAWQAEIIHRAHAQGLTIAECPITYRAGVSHVHGSLIDDALLVWLKVMFL